MIFEIARSLLEVERKHFKSNRRTGLFDGLKIFLENLFIKIKQMQLNTLSKRRKLKIKQINNYL